MRYEYVLEQALTGPEADAMLREWGAAGWRCHSLWTTPNGYYGLVMERATNTLPYPQGGDVAPAR